MAPAPPPYASVAYRSLAGRHVVVTGGASGIGAELVRAFVAQGACVSFLDVDEAAGAATAEATGARFLRCDVTDVAALEAAVDECGRAAPIACLVNNAGNDSRHAIDEVTPESWRRALSLNLDHQFFASRRAACAMKSRGGSIVLTGSVSWMRGRPGLVGYTTAKAAINGMTKTLAREWGADGIRVNCVVPGAIVTERQKALWLTPELDRQFVELQALKFRLDPSHVARVALFLASDESAGCTGANFVVDAGLVQN
ncbi:MAG: SDR family oxidoreductase [Hyphomicrobiales bacterium]|nr:SDR family oxidoreductase [Hyphomicrobiales bacterium]MDE2016661.1 SDR family oxidoreductase [Hyphomicrobiales bacterium]